MTTPALSRFAVIDAAARVVARRGHEGVDWPLIAAEAGNAAAAVAGGWFPDMPTLLHECYSRTAQGLEDSLLSGETSPGSGLDKLAAFLVAALEVRRERGAFLSFRRNADLSLPQQKRLRERDLMIRTRLTRLLVKGRRDGSLAMRSPECACELILASLQVTAITADGPEQRMWDSELVELLLAALAEPHPLTQEAHKVIPVAQGTCLCGAVSYEVDGPFEVMSRCHCSMCRKHHGSTFATFVTAPASGFRWVKGEEFVSTYYADHGARRSFCKTCGAIAPTLDQEGGIVFCPAGSLEGDLGLTVRGHALVGAPVAHE